MTPKTQESSIAERIEVERSVHASGDGPAFTPPAATPIPHGTMAPPEALAKSDAPMEPPKKRRAKRPVMTHSASRAPEETQKLHYWILAAIVGVALLLRLREALVSTILAAEEPYLHMERTYDLVQGKGVQDYPMGFMVLLAPFTIFGPAGFEFVARFLPAVLGAGSVAAVFFLVRPWVHPLGALTASFAVAVMPDHIARTSLLMPQAIDVVVIPMIFLAVLHIHESNRWAMPTAIAGGVFLLLAHPLVVAILLPPVTAYFLIMLWRHRETRSWSASASGATAASFGMVLILAPGPGFAGRIFDTAVPRMMELLVNPASINPLPPYVDIMGMVSMPIIVLGTAGAILSVALKNRFGLLALLYTAMLLPLVLVDWFNVGYIPHRTVVFFGLGLCMLAAIPISELVRVILSSPSKKRVPALWSVVAAVALLMAPAAAAAPEWYRIFDADDKAAYAAIDALDPSVVVSGSWQGKSGYRAVTGNDAMFYPQFFQDDRVRGLVLEQHPGLVVLVDAHATAAAVETGFLAEWVLVGTWGDVSAYRAP